MSNHQYVWSFLWAKKKVLEFLNGCQSRLTKINNRVKLYLPNPENIRSGGPKFLGRIAIWRGVTLSALALQLTS
jgi:hypothetical protein